jgi:hypothetical protein
MFDFISSVNNKINIANELTTGDYFYIVPMVIVIMWVVISEAVKIFKKD